MSKTKSYTQLKADLARIAEQEAAIKKKIAETEKKRKEEAEVIIGKNFLACFSNEDLLSKSSAELRQFVNEICKKAVENRNCKDEDLQKISVKHSLKFTPRMQILTANHTRKLFNLLQVSARGLLNL